MLNPTEIRAAVGNHEVHPFGIGIAVKGILLGFIRWIVTASGHCGRVRHVPGDHELILIRLDSAGRHQRVQTHRDQFVGPESRGHLKDDRPVVAGNPGLPRVTSALRSGHLDELRQVGDCGGGNIRETHQHKPCLWRCVFRPGQGREIQVT